MKEYHRVQNEIIKYYCQYNLYTQEKLKISIVQFLYVVYYTIAMNELPMSYEAESLTHGKLDISSSEIRRLPPPKLMAAPNFHCLSES